MSQLAAAPIFGTEGNATPAWLTLDSSGAITHASGGLKRLFGAAAPEWRGRPLTALLAETAADSSHARLEQFFSTAEEQVQLEVAATSEGGRQAPVRISIWRTGSNGQAAFICLVEARGTEAERDGLRALVGSLLAEREQEGREMAARVHRDLAQKIAAAKLDLFLLTRQLSTADRSVEQRLERIEQGLTDAGEAVQSVCKALYPSELEYLGLGSAVKAFALEANRNSGIKIRVEWDEASPNLAPERAIVLYRIIQEAVKKAVRAPDVKLVTVAEKVVSNRLRVQIRSDRSAIRAAHEIERAVSWTRVRELAGIIRANLEIAVGNRARTIVTVDVHVGDEHEAHRAHSG